MRICFIRRAWSYKIGENDLLQNALALANIGGSGVDEGMVIDVGLSSGPHDDFDRSSHPSVTLENRMVVQRDKRVFGRY